MGIGVADYIGLASGKRCGGLAGLRKNKNTRLFDGWVFLGKLIWLEVTCCWKEVQAVP